MQAVFPRIGEEVLIKSTNEQGIAYAHDKETIFVSVANDLREVNVNDIESVFPGSEEIYVETPFVEEKVLPIIDVKAIRFKLIKYKDSFVFAVKYGEKKFALAQGSLEELRPKYIACSKNRSLMIPAIQRALAS